MLSLLFPPAILLLLLVGILLLVRRFYISGIVIFLLSIVLNFYSETFALHLSGSASRQDESLRILSYNIEYNSSYLKQNKDSLTAMLRFFEQQDADLVVLPESRLKSTNKALYKQLGKLYSYNVSMAYEGNDHYLETYVFSRYPISNVRQLSQYYIYIMDVDFHGKMLKLAACHLESNQEHSQLSGDRGLWSNLSHGYEQRAVQTKLLCDSLNSCDSLPLLVCGDLNDISGSPTLRTLQGELHLHDAWWKGGCGYGATFTDKGLYLRLDHILFSSHFDVTRVNVPSVNFSDHRPVVADFIMK